MHAANVRNCKKYFVWQTTPLYRQPVITTSTGSEFVLRTKNAAKTGRAKARPTAFSLADQQMCRPRFQANTLLKTDANDIGRLHIHSQHNIHFTTSSQAARDAN